MSYNFKYVAVILLVSDMAFCRKTKEYLKHRIFGDAILINADGVIILAVLFPCWILLLMIISFTKSCGGTSLKLYLILKREIH